MSGKKLSKSIIIYGLSNGIKSLVPFVMIPILTSYISPEGVGLLSLLETSILFITPFILLNIEAGVGVEYFNLKKPDLAQYLSNGLLISFVSFCIISLLFLFLGGWISELLGAPQSLVLLLPIFVLLRLVPTLVLVIFQAQQKSVSYLFFSLFQTIFDFALSALFIMVLSRGYIGRLEGIYLSFFITTLMGLIVLYKIGYYNFDISKKVISKILRFGTPLIPHAIGGTIIAMSDRYFIAIFEGNAEVGYYTVAYQIGALMLLFSRSVNQAWSPMLYSLLTKKDYASVEKFTGILFVVFLVVGAGIYLLQDFIFGLFVAPSFLPAKQYITLLLLGFVFQSLYFLFTNFIFYSKRTGVLATITFSGAVLNLVLNFILIKRMGVIGVAYSTAITWFLFMIATFTVTKFKIYKSEKNS